MGAITDTSPFSSSSSVLVNICFAKGSLDRAPLYIAAKNTLNTTDAEWILNLLTELRQGV